MPRSEERMGAAYTSAGSHVSLGRRGSGPRPCAGDGRTSPLESGLVRGFVATDEEIDAVVAFLESLTNEAFLTNPALGPVAAP